MDKIDKLLDAIEHPDRYSDSEIREMLQDPEVKEVFDMLDKTKSSLQPIATPDVDAEWKAFESAHRHLNAKSRFRIFNFVSRNIAASIAIGMVSLVAVAAVVGVSVNYALKHNEDAVSEGAPASNEMVAVTDTVSEIKEIKTLTQDTIVFNNDSLETIINQIAEYYDCKATFSSETSKSLRLYFRWNQAQPLNEVIESLNNFERINITAKDKTITID